MHVAPSGICAARDGHAKGPPKGRAPGPGHPPVDLSCQGGPLARLCEAEEQYYGRMLGVSYAEIFRSAAPLLVDTPNVFRPATHG
jgi:hypothetical protein